MPLSPASQRVVVLLLGSIVANLLLGCEGPEVGARGSVTIDTVAGVVHVANHGEGQWTTEERWKVREVFRLGGPTEPAEQLFTNQILGTGIGPDGNVYVLDHFQATMSVFSRDGDFVRTISRPGMGPSDLSAPTGFTWTPEGHLWISDPQNLKIVEFDSTGSLVDTHPRSIVAFPRRQYSLVYEEGLGIIDQASAGSNVVLLRTTLDGEVHDTLLTVDREGGPSQALVDAGFPPPGPGADYDRVSRHYVARMRWALDGWSGGIWTGSPEELRFVKRDWNGDTLLVVTADHRTSELTPEDERLISDVMSQTGLSRSEINPIRPIFQEIYVIDGGYLLVQLVDTPGTPSSRFDVYDPEGQYLGELDLGFAPHPLGTLGSRGNLVVAPMLGELDVPYVVGVELVGLDDS